MKKKKVEKRIEDVEAVPEDIQKERGFQQGQILAMEEELEELRERLKGSREKGEVAVFLQEKDRELELKKLEGCMSLRGLFDVLSGRKNYEENGRKIKNVSLLSFNEQKYFGDLYDISFNPDGRIGFWIRENGMPRQVISGSTLKNLLWNYEGLNTSIKKSGTFKLALNDTGNYVENPYAEEIPSIIIDANGKYNISHVNKDTLIAQLIDKEREINKLYKYMGMAERALSKVGYEVNLSKLLAKLNEERRKVAETVLTKYAKEGNEMVKNWKIIESELVDKSHQLSIKNTELRVSEGIREKIMKKMESIESGDSVDNAKKEILGYINLLIGLVKGEKVSFASIPKEEEPEPLKREFEKMIGSKG